MNIRSGKTAMYGTALFAVFLWASAFPGVKYSLQYYSPGALMLFRFTVASAALASLGAVRKMRLPSVKDLPLLMAGGFIGIFLYMWLFNTGTEYVTSGISSFIIASSPVFTAIFSFLILKERLRPACWAGILISFAGLVIIAVNQTEGVEAGLGVALLIAASVATSTYSIVQRRILQKYTPLEATTYTMVCATLFMFIFLPGLIREFPAAPVTADLFIVYMGVFPGALAYLAWGLALSKAEKTAHVTVFLYLVPFAATVIAFLWLGETMAPLSFLGGVIIIAGMVVSNKAGGDRH